MGRPILAAIDAASGCNLAFDPENAIPEVHVYRVRQEDLPFRGSSHNFVGADNGNVNVSVFLFNGEQGRGPGPHRHPYDEIQFIQSGWGLWKVDGQEFEAGAGDILVIKAGEVHSFRCISDE